MTPKRTGPAHSINGQTPAVEWINGPKKFEPGELTKLHALLDQRADRIAEQHGEDHPETEKADREAWQANHFASYPDHDDQTSRRRT